jgi:hypothetical protein
MRWRRSGGRVRKGDGGGSGMLGGGSCDICFDVDVRVCGYFRFEVASFRVIGCRWRGGVNEQLNIEQPLVEQF